MLVTLVRTVIIFFTLIVVMRLMGKRQIGEMQPFEFIVTLIIADLACIPMADVSIPLIYGLVAILGLFILHQTLSILEQTGNFFKFVISGKPSIVINKNGVDLKQLKKNNLNVSDLMDSMRSLGYFSLDDVDYAIFESNGKLSTLEKTDKESENNSFPVLIIVDKKPVNDNLNKISVKKDELLNFLKKQKTRLDKVEVLTVDGNGRAYIKEKNKKYSVVSFPLKEGITW